jgi:hypothetical protein
MSDYDRPIPHPAPAPGASAPCSFCGLTLPWATADTQTGAVCCQTCQPKLANAGGVIQGSGIITVANPPSSAETTALTVIPPGGVNTD